MVNESWRLAPWADVLYACDGKWWEKNNGVPAFQGIKVSQDKRACRLFSDVNYVQLVNRSEELITDRPGCIASGSRAGGNSGFQALNLTVQFGAKRILLVGFDMHGEHWHGRHPSGLNNPSPQNFQDWRLAFDRAAPSFAAVGVDVINCSPVSVLQGFRKMDLGEALA